MNRFLCLLFFLTLSAYVDAAPKSYLVSSQWLEERLSTNDVLVIDARTEEEYSKGHIANAVNFPALDTLADESDANKYDSLDFLRTKLSGLGVNNDKQVVVYGEKLTEPARIFWLLIANGQDNVVVLNDSYSNWSNSGKFTETTVTASISSLFIPRPKREKLATTFMTRIAMLDANKAILDVRSEGEYNEAINKTVIAGHIPTAINVPVSQFFDSSGRLKDIDALKRTFYRVHKSRPVIVYSNNGMRSSLAFLVLHELGYKVANYNGSWREWSRDDRLPRE